MDIGQVELTRYEPAGTRGTWLHYHFGRNGRRQLENSVERKRRKAGVRFDFLKIVTLH